MKTIIVLVIILVLSLTKKYNQKHKLKNLDHFRNRFKVQFKYSQRNKVKVKLNNLNRLVLNKRINTEDGILFDQENAPDMFYACQAESDRLSKIGNKVSYQNLFMQYTKRIMIAFDKMEQNVKDAFWIYFVEDQGNCKINNENAGVVFMLLPQGDPRQTDFSNPNMKVPFVKVCINGKPDSKLGLSLTVDPNEKKETETDEKTDKDKDEKTETDEKKDKDEKTDTDDTTPNKQTEVRFIQILRRRNDKDGLQPYLLKYCAFDDCITTPLYRDRELYTDEQTDETKRGKCRREIDENETITLNSDSEQPGRLRIMSTSQCNSIGRLLS